MSFVILLCVYTWRDVDTSMANITVQHHRRHFCGNLSLSLFLSSSVHRREGDDPRIPPHLNDSSGHGDIILCRCWMDSALFRSSNFGMPTPLREVKKIPNILRQTNRWEVVSFFFLSPAISKVIKAEQYLTYAFAASSFVKRAFTCLSLNIDANIVQLQRKKRTSYYDDL